MEKLYRLLKCLIAVLAAAVVIVGGGILLGRSGAPEAPAQTMAAETTVPEETQAASQAPEFTFYDAEGTAHTMSEFRGKPVLLNFWASWCGPCKSEMPEFQNYYEKYGEDVHFVIVNLTDGAQETVESASAYIAREGYTFPVYYDTDMEGAYAYGVSAVPVSYFIDAEGYFAAWAQGALSADMLQQGMDLLLG